MVKYREIIRLRSKGTSIRNIAFSVDCSTATVQSVLRKAQMQGLDWPLEETLDDAALFIKLFPAKPKEVNKKEPNWPHVHKELAKKGVTLSLLWSEYLEECQGANPYLYSAFCRKYRAWAVSNKLVMHIEHKPGCEMQVDYAGMKMAIADPDTGELLDVYVFVASLPYSGYIFAKGFLKTDEEGWLKAHLDAFSFFGGTTTIIIPDNLKTGITKNNYEELIINESYRRMAEYYGCAIVPARPSRPRDKGHVEMSVGVVTRSALAALRNRVFTSTREFNEALLGKVDEINSRTFQKRPGSRKSVFLSEEKDALMPLPPVPYELCVVKTATVQFNYHVYIDGVYYSCPFSYVRREVECRIYPSSIAIFAAHERIALHKRSFARKGAYVTDTSHMPEAHKDFASWNADRFKKWALEYGQATHAVIEAILTSRSVEQHSYRSC